MSTNTNIPTTEAVERPLTKEEIKLIINQMNLKMEGINDDLVDRLVKIEFEEYFDIAQRSCFSHINLDFMDDLMKIARSKYLYIVDHIELKKYGVLTNIKTSGTVQRSLERYFMEAGRDYYAYESEVKRKQGGKTKKIEYILTQAAFKKCLMRAENCDHIADYYILLELVISFHSDYRIRYSEKLLQERETTITNLERQVQELIQLSQQNNVTLTNISTQNTQLLSEMTEVKEQNNHLTEQNDELLEKVSDVEGELQETKGELRETTNRLDGMQDTLDIVVEQRNIPPENPVLSHEFVLIKLSDTDTHEVYRVIRGQKKSVSLKMKALPEDTTTVMHRQLEPNPIDAFNRLKEEIVKFNDQIMKNIGELQIARKERTLRKREYRKSPAITFKNNNVNIKKNSDYINSQGFIDMVIELLDEKYEVEP